MTTKTAQIYQVHVLLHDVEPAVWRRLLVCGDATLTDLHAIVQIAFGWRDDGRHNFVIRGKTYGDGNVMPESPTLATFGFRPKERFEYGYGGRWRHQIRFEEANGLAAPHPVCLAGARVAPAEDRSMRSDGPDDYEHVEPLSTDWLCLYEGLIRLAEGDREKSRAGGRPLGRDTHAGIPTRHRRSPFFIKYAGTNLQQMMAAALGPAHLLFLHGAPTDEKTFFLKY